VAPIYAHGMRAHSDAGPLLDSGLTG